MTASIERQATRGVRSWPVHWLAVLLTGLALFGAVLTVLLNTGNPVYLPSLLLLGAAVVPATLTTFITEFQPAPRLSVARILTIAVFGGVVGGVLAGQLEFDTARTLGSLPFPMIGLIEESAKLAIPVVLFAWRRPWCGRWAALVDTQHGPVLPAPPCSRSRPLGAVGSAGCASWAPSWAWCTCTPNGTPAQLTTATWRWGRPASACCCWPPGGCAVTTVNLAGCLPDRCPAQPAGVSQLVPRSARELLATRVLRCACSESAEPTFDAGMGLVHPGAVCGIEAVVADLADGLVERGHDVVLLGAGRVARRLDTSSCGRTCRPTASASHWSRWSTPRRRSARCATWTSTSFTTTRWPGASLRPRALRRPSPPSTARSTGICERSTPNSGGACRS